MVQTTGVEECGHEGIRHGHLSIEHSDQDVGTNLGFAAQRQDHVEFVCDVVAEKETRRKVTAQALRFAAQPLVIVEQFGRRARRRQGSSHFSVCVVEAAAVMQHRTGDGTQRCTQPAHQMGEHLVVGPALTQAGM